MRIQEYCREREGYDGVANMCSAIRGPRKLPSDDDVDPGEHYGFVYLMKSGRYYKLGRADHVGGRERDLAIQLPDKIITLHSIRTDDPVGIEAYWHKRFDATRKNGEWFDLSNSDVKAFKRRKFMESAPAKRRRRLRKATANAEPKPKGKVVRTRRRRVLILGAEVSASDGIAAIARDILREAISLLAKRNAKKAIDPLTIPGRWRYIQPRLG